jgi:hypothetical protein
MKRIELSLMYLRDSYLALQQLNLTFATGSFPTTGKLHSKFVKQVNEGGLVVDFQLFPKGMKSYRMFLHIIFSTKGKKLNSKDSK